MIKARSLFLALLLSTLCTGSALADTFDFSFTGQSFSGIGQLTATDLGSGTYLIGSATGTVDLGLADKSISLLSPGSFQNNDNLLYYPTASNPSNSAAFFDGQGVSFLLSNGAKVNLFLRYGAVLVGPGGAYTVFQAGTTTVSPTSELSPTPEPSSLLLLGTGCIAGLVVMRRKFAAVSAMVCAQV